MFNVARVDAGGDATRWRNFRGAEANDRDNVNVNFASRRPLGFIELVKPFLSLFVSFPSSLCPSFTHQLRVGARLSFSLSLSFNLQTTDGQDARELVLAGGNFADYTRRGESQLLIAGLVVVPFDQPTLLVHPCLLIL